MHHEAGSADKQGELFVSRRPWWLLPPGRVQPAWWVLFGLLVVWADYMSGPGTHFPLLYAIPVTVAAWYSGRWTALALAVSVPVLRILLLVTGVQAVEDRTSLILSTMLRGAVVIVMALWFDRLADFERELRHRVKALEGLLNICSFCKSIKNDEGSWERLEGYISHRSKAEFSHGLCPSCAERHYSQWLDR